MVRSNTHRSLLLVLVCSLIFVIAGCDDAPARSQDAQTILVTHPQVAGGNLQRTNAYTNTGTPRLDSVLWASQDFDYFFGEPTITADKAYFVQTSQPNLVALDLKTGQLAWSLEDINELVRFTVADNVIYYAKDNHLRAMDTITQREKWVKEEWIIGRDIGVTQAPLVMGGLVYFGTDDGGFHALNAETGREEGQYQVEVIQHTDAGGNSCCLFGRGYIQGQPITIGDNIIFGTAYNYVYSLNRITGQFNWRTRVGDFASGEISVYNDNLYLMGATVISPFTPGALLTTTSIAAQTQQEWKEPPMLIFEDSLYSLDVQTGAILWKIDKATPGFSSWQGCSDPPILDNDLVYCALSYDATVRAGIIYAFDASNGRLVWQKVAKYELMSDSIAIYDGFLFVNAPAPYMSGEGSQLFAFDAKTGEDRWVFNTGRGFFQPIIADGTLYLATTDDDGGLLYALDPSTGKELRSIALQKIATPPIIHKGIAYIVAKIGKYSTHQRLIAVP